MMVHVIITVNGLADCVQDMSALEMDSLLDSGLAVCMGLRSIML